MKPSPSAPRKWSRPGRQVLRADLQNTDAKALTAMERNPTSEIRSRLLKMILDNEQQRKSLVSSTSISQNQLDA